MNHYNLSARVTKKSKAITPGNISVKSISTTWLFCNKNMHIIPCGGNSDVLFLRKHDA